MKKIAIIGTVGIPSKYGGFETLAEQLVRNLGDKYAFTVYCTAKKYSKDQRSKNFLSARLKYIPFNANGIQSIFYDAISIFHALFFADVLLVLGVAGAWLLPFVKLFTNKKIIVSVDGIEWKRDKWNPLAKFYLYWAEKIAVKFSHIDISDNESIQDYTAMRYGSLSRIIEYGGDHVEPREADSSDQEKYPFLKLLYAVKVCRIEPENNVHSVLEAFSKIKNRSLVIVGNWNNSTYGKELKKKYKDFDNIYMLDPIYNQREIDLIRSNAIIYVHGHAAGGTNPSLVEAMSLGLPVIAFDISYNRTTTENKAKYFKNSDDIIDFVSKTYMEQLKKFSIQMKDIAERRYKWSLIASKYNTLFKEVLIVASKKPVESDIKNINNEILLNLHAAHLKNQHLFYEK